MIKAALIVCFVAVALAAPAPEEIISYDAVDHKHQQSGQAGEAVKGSYSYTDAEGKSYTINYVADENGYRADGEHLPVAPEMPAVPEPAGDPAPEPAPEPAAAADSAPEPAPAEAPAAEVKAVETPASTATFVAPTFRYIAAPYAGNLYAGSFYSYPVAAAPYSYGGGYGGGYGYGYAISPFYG